MLPSMKTVVAFTATWKVVFCGIELLLAISSYNVYNTKRLLANGEDPNFIFDRGDGQFISLLQYTSQYLDAGNPAVKECLKAILNYGAYLTPALGRAIAIRFWPTTQHWAGQDFLNFDDYIKQITADLVPEMLSGLIDPQDLAILFDRNGIFALYRVLESIPKRFRSRTSAIRNIYLYLFHSLNYGRNANISGHIEPSTPNPLHWEKRRIAWNTSFAIKFLKKDLNTAERIATTLLFTRLLI